MVSLNTRHSSPDFCFYPHLDVEAQTLLGWMFESVQSMSNLIKVGFHLTIVLSQEPLGAATSLIPIELR